MRALIAILAALALMLSGCDGKASAQVAKDFHPAVAAEAAAISLEESNPVAPEVPARSDLIFRQFENLGTPIENPECSCDDCKCDPCKCKVELPPQPKPVPVSPPTAKAQTPFRTAAYVQGECTDGSCGLVPGGRVARGTARVATAPLRFLHNRQPVRTFFRERRPVRRVIAAPFRLLFGRRGC